MSRFGREYLQVGYHLEVNFPMKNVRFIAINDGVDSARGQDDFTPFRNLFNDFYARDTSRKVRAVMKAKGTSGEHLNRPPYGYLEDPMRKGHWIIDPETAPVVKRIFDLALAGNGPKRIANLLEKDHVPTAKAIYDLNRYLESLRDIMKYDKWFYGHLHDNRRVFENDFLLYEQIIRIN